MPVLNEKKIVEKILKIIGVENDDAYFHKGTNLVFTTDVMFESTHFPLLLSPEEIGRKIAVANFSDVAAMGAKPFLFLASFGLNPDYPEDELLRIIKGIRNTCGEHNAIYGGGDTKKAKELTIAGFAVGNIKGKVLKRSNAKPNDSVYCTGNVGNAACGLIELLKGRRNEWAENYVKKTARIDYVPIISKYANACMDITDGFFYTMGEIEKMSGVGIEIQNIPTSEKVREYCRKNHITLKKLLSIGEDYELVFTIPGAREKVFLKQCAKRGLFPIKIGRVIKRKRGYSKESGYDAFISKV